MKNYLAILFILLLQQHSFAQQKDSVLTSSELHLLAESNKDYHEAEPTGGMSNFSKYIFSEVDAIRFTENEAVIFRKAFIGFTISETGALTDVEIVRSCNIARVDELLIKIYKRAPAWKAATYKNTPIKVRWQMPLQVCFK